VLQCNTSCVHPGTLPPLAVTKKATFGLWKHATGQNYQKGTGKGPTLTRHELSFLTFFFQRKRSQQGENVYNPCKERNTLNYPAKG
jgi:hypothetical protein